jgi:predicted acylesterase/phospholipase RssA
VHRSGPASTFIRASVAIPGVLPPVPYGEDLLVDGGVLNNLPVEMMRSDGGIGTVIAVDVAPPRGPRARSDYGLSVSGFRASRRRCGGSARCTRA